MTGVLYCCTWKWPDRAPAHRSSEEQECCAFRGNFGVGEGDELTSSAGVTLSKDTNVEQTEDPTSVTTKEVLRSETPVVKDNLELRRSTIQKKTLSYLKDYE